MYIQATILQLTRAANENKTNVYINISATNEDFYLEKQSTFLKAKYITSFWKKVYIQLEKKPKLIQACFQLVCLQNRRSCKNDKSQDLAQLYTVCALYFRILCFSSIFCPVCLEKKIVPCINTFFLNSTISAWMFLLFLTNNFFKQLGYNQNFTDRSIIVNILL